MAEPPLARKRCFEKRLSWLYSGVFLGLELLGIFAFILWGTSPDPTSKREWASAISWPVLAGSLAISLLAGGPTAASFRVLARLVPGASRSGADGLKKRIALLPWFFAFLALLIGCSALVWLAKWVFTAESSAWVFQVGFVFLAILLGPWPRRAEAGSLERFLGATSVEIEEQLGRTVS